jgi:hypothetical protein
MSVETNEDERNAPTLTYSQSRNRADEIQSRMEQIGELDKPTDEENAEFRDLGVEFDSLVEHMEPPRACRRAGPSPVGRHRDHPARCEARTARRAGQQLAGIARRLRPRLHPRARQHRGLPIPQPVGSVGGTHLRPPPGEVAGELRARALSAVEKMQGASDNIRQAAANIIEQFDDGKSTIARMCLATSSPAYVRAWSKLAKNHGNSLTVDEQRAVEQVRAMSLTDANGGYLVPFQLDPTVIMTSAGSRSDIRQVARQVVVTGDNWKGVSSANVSWSWDAEASEVSDDSPTFAQPAIPNYTARGFVPISIEALEDEQNVTQEVGRLLMGGKNDLEASAFITGTGSGQPTGIVTALVGGSSVVNAATDDTFASRTCTPCRVHCRPATGPTPPGWRTT